MKNRFLPSATPPPQPAAAPLYFPFRDGKLLAPATIGKQLLSTTTFQFNPGDYPQQYLGMLDNHPCFSVQLSTSYLIPEGYAFSHLRKLFFAMPELLAIIAGRAKQIADWDETHRFCGRCATPTVQLPNNHTKECPNCGLTSFPRLAPAIIVLVNDGEKLLLARSPRFPEGMYSTLAGFVEPGETLEEAVAREIKEESGISVKNISYFGSQPWPFPHSLMIGFFAEYAGGEIILEDDEIEDARWFRKDALPAIPPKFSIARRLIDTFLSR